MKFEPAGFIRRRAQIKTSGGGDYNVRIKKFNTKNNTLNCKEELFGNTTHIDVDKIVSIKAKSLLVEILYVILCISFIFGGWYYITKQPNINDWYNINYDFKNKHQKNIRYDE